MTSQEPFPQLPPGHGAPGYGPPSDAPGYGYGPPPWAYPFPRAYWPNGPLRPPAATASGVLGIVTGGLTALAALFLLGLSFSGDGDAISMFLLVSGVPCAAGLLTGGIRLLGGHRRGMLVASSLAAIAVLVLAFLIGMARYDGEDVVGLFLWVLFALPLPVATAIVAAQPTVKGWTEDPRLG